MSRGRYKGYRYEIKGDIILLREDNHGVGTNDTDKLLNTLKDLLPWDTLKGKRVFVHVIRTDMCYELVFDSKTGNAVRWNQCVRTLRRTILDNPHNLKSFF